MTTGETTSHPTKQLEDCCQVVGYSHLTDKATSHSTRLSKDDNQAAGYSPASEKLLMEPLAIRLSEQTTLAKSLVMDGHPKDTGQVIDGTTSHLTKAENCQVIGYGYNLSLIHISEPTRLGMISYAVFCLK